MEPNVSIEHLVINMKLLMLLVMLHLILMIIHVSLKLHQPQIIIQQSAESRLVLISKWQNVLHHLQELYLVYLMELSVFKEVIVLHTKLKLHVMQVDLMEFVCSLLLLLNLLMVHVLKWLLAHKLVMIKMLAKTLLENVYGLIKLLPLLLHQPHHPSVKNILVLHSNLAKIDVEISTTLKTVYNQSAK